MNTNLVEGVTNLWGLYDFFLECSIVVARPSHLSHVSHLPKKRKMAPQWKLTLGVGATVSCLLKFLHPSEHIRNAFPNPAHAQQLSDCVVV